jgi:hypothetical protein
VARLSGHGGSRTWLVTSVLGTALESEISTASNRSRGV